MTTDRPKQDYSMYKNMGAYDHKGRWLSYFYQYKTVLSKKPKRVLEVGVGNGTTAQYLRTVGVPEVVTADYEAALQPDVVADVTKLPFKDKEFDVAICCEVLEHLPFAEFENAVQELTRVSKFVYLTVPDHRRVVLSIDVKLPFLPKLRWSLRLNRFFTPHIFDGFHYWEIGKQEYPLRKIITTLRSANIIIEQHGSYQDAPLIHYFHLSDSK